MDELGGGEMSRVAELRQFGRHRLEALDRFGDQDLFDAPRRIARSDFDAGVPGGSPRPMRAVRSQRLQVKGLIRLSRRPDPPPPLPTGRLNFLST